MLQCYNRGCGQKFDPEKNDEDSCCYHPGEPFFHDAYKGWSCCNKKSVDFTEFLNTKGCTKSKHSNEKPPEPKKPEKREMPDCEEPVVLIRKPIKSKIERPPFDTPMTVLTPSVMLALKDAIDCLEPHSKGKENERKSGEIAIGTACRNGGCSATYTSTECDETECQYHPGVPVFHEGMKFWSCCMRRTSDFTAFMNQVGCTYGKHKWIGDNDDTKVDCRYDWHQTPSNVIIAIYAKMYHYAKSTVKVNPIRLTVCLVFPKQNDAEFNLDLELRGVIKVDSTTVEMYPTKVEITMPKAESSHWAQLDFPRTMTTSKQVGDSEIEVATKNEKESNTKIIRNSSNSGESSDENFLDDIETASGAQIKNIN